MKKNYEMPEITVTVLTQDVLLNESVIDSNSAGANDWTWNLDSIWNKFW